MEGNVSLLLIKDTVQKAADAITDVLNFDVIIVDSELAIIGNTYARMVEDDISVHMESIVGDTVSTGERQVFLDKSERGRCRACDFAERCIIGGVLSVPISFDEATVGAIGVIFKNDENSDWVKEHRDGITDFLESMADLLSGKLESLLQIEQVEKSQNERELIIETISDALVFVDNDGRIVYRNSRFDEYFHVREDAAGKSILSIVGHPLIANHLTNRRNLSDKIIAYETPELNFLGLVTCRNIKVHGGLLGTIIIFKRMDEAYRLVHEISNTTNRSGFDDIIWVSDKMGQIIRNAKEIAVKDDNIIITGSPGTGKQLFAGAVHRFSNRNNRYLLTAHCATMSRSQYLSEFFGIGEGDAQMGEFHLAAGGTVLLLGICELPLSIQKDLSEYLSTGEINLENGTVVKIPDIRFIATTSENPLDRVKSGDLLEELYFRLREQTITLPDLKDRTITDFRALMDRFLEEYHSIHGKLIRFNPEAFELLWRYAWPGNIKELSRVLEKLVVLSPTEDVDAEFVERLLYSRSRLVDSEAVLDIDEYEKQIISNAMKRYEGSRNSKSIAAEKLGISRATLYRKIKKYKLDRMPDLRSDQ